MAETKTLACIGLNGFEQARIRLVLDEVSKRLPIVWKLGPAGNADLLLLADGTAEAAAASLTASGRGIRCVYLREGAETGIDTLPPDFNAEDLEFILSTTFSQGPGFYSIDATMPEFFETIGEGKPESSGQQDESEYMFEFPLDEASRASTIPEAVELEQYLQRDSAEYTLDRIVPIKLNESVQVKRTADEAPTNRAAFRGNMRDPYIRPTSPKHDSSMWTTADTARKPAANARMLEDYIREDLLVAPCRLQLDGSKALILDPKHRVFIIEGGLAAAEPYAIQAFSESDFERLTTRELERARDEHEPESFLRLQWLLALRRGEDWLPRHLDPGGSFRVGRMMELGPHFDEQVRIGEVLHDWYRLHEVAAQAGVDMGVVFHTVTAFDAIGWLETRPRERRR